MTTSAELLAALAEGKTLGREFKDLFRFRDGKVSANGGSDDREWRQMSHHEHGMFLLDMLNNPTRFRIVGREDAKPDPAPDAFLEMRDLIAAAKAEERERCAKACEHRAALHWVSTTRGDEAARCASAIRELKP